MEVDYLQSVDGQFHGHEAFLERRKDLRVGQGVRVYNYGTMSDNECLFAVGLEGKLYDDNQEVVDPEDVLNEEDGWCFDDMILGPLPDEVIKRMPI